MKEIAERIKKIRLERGMTQQDLADALGLKSRSSINKIEMDTYEISLEKAKKIAKALNVDPDYLIFGDEEDKREEINRLFEKLDPRKQDAVLAFLQSLIEEGEEGP